MEHIDNVDVWSVSPRAECPASVVGGFNGGVAVYSVAKKGGLKRLGHSASCRFQGDPLPKPFVIPEECPRILIVYHGAGNAPTYGRLYK